jgi:hypothetical protein
MSHFFKEDVELLPPNVFNAAKKGDVDLIFKYLMQNPNGDVNSVGQVRARSVFAPDSSPVCALSRLIPHKRARCSCSLHAAEAFCAQFSTQHTAM